jgi:MFS transporter, DHA1 family, multidrug resistance protein
MLFLEPIVLCLTLYIAFIYGVIFLFLLIIPLTNVNKRGYSPLVSNLTLLSFSIGFIICLPLVRLLNRLYCSRPHPETRLYAAMVAAFVFPVAILWWAWTAPFPGVPWIVPVLSGVPFAMATMAVWLGVTDYLVDLYDKVGWGASAIAASAVLRSSFAGTFPLFGNGMECHVGGG